MELLEKLESVGSLRLLLLLQVRQRYVTELIKRAWNPEGIMSQDALRKCRNNLSKLGLVKEVMEEGPRPKKFLVITDKGRKVAEKVCEIQDILEE